MNTCTTTGTISDVSTTVAGTSLKPRVQKNLSVGANFAELGLGMVSDTPRSKQSIDFRSAYRGNRPNSLLKVKTIENQSNLGLREQNRRYSMIRSFTKTGDGNVRSSTRNLINPGGLNHFNFI